MLSRAYQNQSLPRWASLLLSAVCIGIGLWASVVTLKFFEHGAVALESDPALQALAKAAAYLFVFAEMSAFILAALIVGRELSARRWSLYAYAAVVLIVEIFTISAIQIATVVGADMTQASVSESLIDLRKQIVAVEEQVATYTANAASLRANDQLKKAAQQTDKATAEQDKAAKLYTQLGTVRDAKRPTVSGMLGETLAIGYVIVRGLLVPATGLIFFGVAGALMLRRADGLSVEERILMALNRVEGAPAALPVATMQGAPVVPAVSFKQPGTVTPEGASSRFSFGSKAALFGAAGAGLLAATAAPVAHSAPAVPAAPAAGPVIVDTPTTVIVDTPPVIVDTPAPRQRTQRAPRSERGEIMDTGIGEHDGHRFRRALSLIKAGQARPSQDGLFKAVRASRPVADRYLAAWAAVGEIVQNPDGAGWVLAPAPKTKKAKKVGAA